LSDFHFEHGVRVTVTTTTIITRSFRIQCEKPHSKIPLQ